MPIACQLLESYLEAYLYPIIVPGIGSLSPWIESSAKQGMINVLVGFVITEKMSYICGELSNHIAMSQENTYIRFDWAMKHMLRDKSNFGILEGLISVLLNEEVKIVELLESESNQDSDTDKFNRVDIKAKNSKGHLIIVEVQLTRQLHYYERILHGTCNANREHINIGKEYDQVKKWYSISLLFCNFGYGDDYVYHGETRFKGIHTGNELILKAKEKNVIVTHLPQEVTIDYYFVRLYAYDKIPETPLDEWMTYLKTGIVNENTQTRGLLEVKEKMQVLSMTIKEYRAYEAFMDTIMVQNDEFDTARDEGFAEGLAEVRAKLSTKEKIDL